MTLTIEDNYRPQSLEIMYVVVSVRPSICLCDGGVPGPQAQVYETL